MNVIQTKLDYADAIADWYLELAETKVRQGELEEGLKHTHIAATILSKQNRILSSPRIESNLRFIASRLAMDDRLRLRAAQQTGLKKVCLHVLSEALPAGGLTAMAIRWMTNDSERIHSVALLSQEIPIPVELLEAVAHTGGTVYEASSKDSFLSRAAWLRKLTHDVATYAVLHIDVSDVICGAAYGAKGGPPVLLVNHAAHVFWAGISIADLIVNCRGSALEGLWTMTHRGCSRYAMVPIPLTEQKALPIDTTSHVALRQQAKRRIGIPTDSFVMLTVGAPFKYLPANGLDFLEVCESVLRQIPKSFLLVAGFEADGRWKTVLQRWHGRVKVLGTVWRSELGLIHEGTDVYIEGFPFGTTTSLLEAALKGVPVVLAPAKCPPPYGSDGVALDGTLTRPSSIEEYKAQIIRLSTSEAVRLLEGEKIRQSVKDHHTGSGWRQHLKEALQKLPQEHSAYPSIMPIRTTEAIHEYWSEFVAKAGCAYEETFETAFTRALTMNLRPPMDIALQQIFKNFRSVRIHRTVPMPLLALLRKCASIGLPILWERYIFQLLSFLCRASLMSRVLKKVHKLLGRGEGPKGYDAYAHIRGCSEMFTGAKRNA